MVVITKIMYDGDCDDEDFRFDRVHEGDAGNADREVNRD